MLRRVAVGISGGVDSAVAALLLQQRGFDVRPVFMKNWDLVDEHGQCPGEADLQDARWVCDRLRLPAPVEVNFVKEYWNEVFGNFLHDYETGITPNPDILCNRHIKFDAFFAHCTRTLGVDAIATGHYARSSFGEFLQHAPPADSDENARLLCAVDAHKDQTFFLSQMPQRALRRTMFPLGPLRKPTVKELARRAGLERIAGKRESTGICFVGRRNFAEFIGAYIADRPGEFRNHDTGQIVGRHRGFHRWTVGQRSRVDGNPRPLFVQRKCDRTNAIYLAAGTEHRALFCDSLYTDRPVWLADDPLAERGGLLVFDCEFRFQHTKPLTGCRLVRTGNGGLMVRLDGALRAITPGQYAVFYRNGECLGSARITAPGPSAEDLTEDGTI